VGFAFARKATNSMNAFNERVLTSMSAQSLDIATKIAKTIVPDLPAVVWDHAINFK
jgi:hypothetical protein